MHSVRLLQIRQRLLTKRLNQCSKRHASSLTCSLFDRHGPPCRGVPLVQRRGATSKTTISVNGLLGSHVEPAKSLAKSEDAGPAYPTVVQQARSNMRKYDNCVLLTRVGSFYEVSTTDDRGLTMVMLTPIVALFRTCG